MILKRIAITLPLVLFSVLGCAQEEKAEPESQPKRAALEMFDWKPMQEAQELAAKNDKKVLIYANAVWCTYCKKMEKEVFSADEVQNKTKEHFYPVWIDIESTDSLTFRGDTMTQIQFARAMRITGTPTFIFFDSEGEIIAGQPGFIPEEMYLQILDYVGTDAYQEKSFGEFAEIETETQD